MTITKEMLVARRDALWASLNQIQGALECITELLEAVDTDCLKEDEVPE
jgi:hypothetical protein